MATLYQKKLGSDLYEVKNHGATVRLYKNGVCHSDYNPGKVFNGAVWDLMFIGSLANLSSRKDARVLVLGVGGGNVIHSLKKYYPNLEITAVDIDELNLNVAKKYFKVKYPGVNLICEDAYKFLSKNKKKFDVIIDDIFTEINGEPMRALPFDEQWYTLVRKSLNQDGIHIANTAGLNEFKSHDIYKKRLWMKEKLNIKYMKAPKCDNAVFIFSPDQIEKKKLNSELEKIGVWPVKKANPYPEYQLRNLI